MKDDRKQAVRGGHCCAAISDTIGFGLSFSCYLRLSFSAMAHNCPGCWFSQLPKLPSKNSIVLSLTSETNTNTIIVNYSREYNDYRYNTVPLPL
jgi:hypothetical protein